MRKNSNSNLTTKTTEFARFCLNFLFNRIEEIVWNPQGMKELLSVSGLTTTLDFEVFSFDDVIVTWTFSSKRYKIEKGGPGGCFLNPGEWSYLSWIPQRNQSVKSSGGAGNIVPTSLHNEQKTEQRGIYVKLLLSKTRIVSLFFSESREYHLMIIPLMVEKGVSDFYWQKIRPVPLVVSCQVRGISLEQFPRPWPVSLHHLYVLESQEPIHTLQWCVTGDLFR